MTTRRMLSNLRAPRRTDCLRLVATLIAAVVLASGARAATYRVGPGESVTRVSSVASRLQPGDVVEVTGDITDSITLGVAGTWDRPVTLRGVTRIENGRIVRPKITPSSQRERYVINCTADWNVIEGLELGGLWGSAAVGINLGGDNCVLRNSYIHHFTRSAMEVAGRAANSTVEFCEFDSNCNAVNSCTINIWTMTSGGKATIEHCYFHNQTNGTVVKTRAGLNIIRYNWFEDPYYSILKIVDPYPSRGALEGDWAHLYPMHSDIVGNVFFQGWSPGPMFGMFQIGGEGEESVGTEGDFNIAHNLFVMTTARPAEDPPVPLVVHGNVDNVRLYSNVFLEYGVPGSKIYERGLTWNSPRTEQFIARRGSPDPIISGSNNWISERSTGIPEELLETLRGLNPKFVDLLRRDFRPRADSPLAGAGAAELPRGASVSLLPEFEPQRGIAPDLKAKPRRKAEPPSIGPFEVE